jgi:hypothetical protein
MKNGLKFLIALKLSILSMLTLVSARPFYFNDLPYYVSKGIDDAVRLSAPVFEKIIGDYSTSEFFFHKVLLLILLVIICKFVLDKTHLFETNKKVNIILSLIISVLSIRFINENNFFQTIFIQYGVLGIAITTALPMVIFFFFIHNTQVGTYGRKMFWAIYTVTLTGIWISKSAEIPRVGHQIYGVLVFFAIIFILMDKQIHSYFGLSHFKVFMKRSNREGILRANERIEKLTERRGKGMISEYEFRQGIKEEEKLIKEFSEE